MDPLERLIVQTDINKLSEQALGHSGVQDILMRARTASDKRAWEEAKALLADAKAMYVPKVRVIDLLVSEHLALTPASGRRLISRGIVSVNGVRLRDVSRYVGASDVVTCAGSVVQAGGGADVREDVAKAKA